MNINQNYNEISPYIHYDGHYQKTENKCWQVCEEIGNLCTITGNIKWATAMENGMEKPQKN